MKDKKTVVLIGAPNAEKSSVFKEITAFNQHTYDCTEVTDNILRGEYYYKFNDYELVNLPDTYSLFSADRESSLSHDYLCFGEYDCVICTLDSKALFRSLTLVLQVLELTDKAVVFLNHTDEARRKNISIDSGKLSELLGVAVVRSTSKSGRGISSLLEEVHLTVSGKRLFSKTLLCMCTPQGREAFSGIDVNDESYVKELMLSVTAKASYAVSQTVTYLPLKRKRIRKALKRIFNNKYILIPIILLILSVIIYIISCIF